MMVGAKSAGFEPAKEQLDLWSPIPSVDEWTVRESHRAKRLILRVSNSGQVEVVVPRRTSARTVERFVSQHREWIEGKREEVRRLAKPAEPFPPVRIELSATGQTLRVHLSGGKGPTRMALLAPGLLGITGRIDNPSSIRAAMKRWLIASAKRALEPLLKAAALEAGLGYKKIAIRHQRTRWGSCSSRGTISLNCCLLFQPPAVVRYLLIHELAHTVHMNHSRRFWALVKDHCPDYERLDRELLEGWRRVPAWV